MIKNLLTLFVSLFMVIGFAIGTAHAFRGIFEAPMVDVGGTEVGGSEGKIGRTGLYKVELPFVLAGTYKLCLGADTTEVFLGVITLTEAGELKFTGDLGAQTLENPYFIIYTGGTAGTCDGTAEWVSGMTII